MLRWPDCWKWIDGKKSRIKYLQGFLRKLASMAENIFIRVNPLPSSGVNITEKRNKKIIVSLTSYPKRIDACYYAIKSLMLQSLKADRIILWLSKQQFFGRKLPEKFNELINSGLEIRYTEDDLKSHKKYYYILQEQNPDELIITFDDDLIYDVCAIERLIRGYLRNPDCVICNRAIKLKHTKEKGFVREDFAGLYDDEGVTTPSFMIAPSTGAGCLYPYGIMPATTFNEKDIRELAMTADDLWIWYNCMLANVGVIKTRKVSRTFCEVWGSQKEKLSDLNNGGGENDRVLARLFKRVHQVDSGDDEF